MPVACNELTLFCSLMSASLKTAWAHVSTLAPVLQTTERPQLPSFSALWRHWSTQQSCSAPQIYSMRTSPLYKCTEGVYSSAHKRTRGERHDAPNLLIEHSELLWRIIWRMPTFSVSTLNDSMRRMTRQSYSGSTLNDSTRHDANAYNHAPTVCKSVSAHLPWERQYSRNVGKTGNFDIYCSTDSYSSSQNYSSLQNYCSFQNNLFGIFLFFDNQFFL